MPGDCLLAITLDSRAEPGGRPEDRDARIPAPGVLARAGLIEDVGEAVVLHDGCGRR